MKSYLWLLGLAASLVLLSAGSALGQCRARGEGQAASAGTAAVTARGMSAIAYGQLLTGPGSWHYDVMMQQQLQQAIVQQQHAIAVQAKHAQRLANAQKRRAEAATKLEIERARRSTVLAKQ